MSILRLAAVMALAASLAACGFQLRGSAALPFETLYVPNAGAGVGLELKRHVETGTNARVIDDPKTAQAQLELTDEQRTRDILSLTGAGRVREFRLGYSVTYRVRAGAGRDFVPPTTLRLTRDVTYSDTDVLAKQEEEDLLYRDMQSDAVRQILRRLAAARAPG